MRASIEGIHFHYIPRTVASELGNLGATETEISSIACHAPEFKVIKTNVRPEREAALRVAEKRKLKKLKIKSSKSLI